jgi:signal peptidase I
VKTLDDRFDALRDELELAIRPTAPGISEFRPAGRRVFLSVALAVLLGIGFAAYTRRSARVAPAVSTSNWFEEKSRTMEPTLGQFDKVQVDYNFTTLDRSDLVVARVPDVLSAEPMILRVLGLPGESVQLRKDGSAFIDGSQLKEEYLKIPAELTVRSAEVISVVLGPREYFLAGDNRETPDADVFVVAEPTKILARAEHGCSLFMNPEVTASQLAAVKSAFETEPAVRSFRYVDKNEALNEIKHLFPEMGDYSFAPEGSGVPTSFRAVMIPAIDSGKFEARTKALPGVSILRCGLPIIDPHYEPAAAEPIPVSAGGVQATVAPVTTVALPSVETSTG